MDQPDRGPAASSRGRLPIGAPTLAVAAAVIAAGVAAWALLPSSGNGAPQGATAPPERAASAPRYVVAAPPRVREAYEYAATHGAELAYIPCYCGCGGHDGHRNVRDCFIKSGAGNNATYEEHGSQCDVCVSIVLETKAMLARGDSLAQTRAAIDLAWADIGDPTDTPLPPGMEE